MFIPVNHAYVKTGLMRHICKPYPHAFVLLGYGTNLAGYSAAGDQQASNEWPDPTRPQNKRGTSTGSHMKGSANIAGGETQNIIPGLNCRDAIADYDIPTFGET